MGLGDKNRIGKVGWWRYGEGKLGGKEVVDGWIGVWGVWGIVRMDLEVRSGWVVDEGLG